MMSNRIMWGIVSLIVLITVAVTLGTMNGQSQQNNANQIRKEPTPVKNPFEDLSKYAIGDYDAPESSNALEREQRRIKNQRYDTSVAVLTNPDPEDIGSKSVDVEPLPLPIPSNGSTFVAVGEILNASAFLSNGKKGIYSEYSFYVQSIVMPDKQNRVVVGDTVVVDRAGGVVKYPNGHKMLYLIDWQNLPEQKGRYLFFLIQDNLQNPNYKILTAYRIENGKVMALDNHPDFQAFNGTSETEFIKLILSKK